MERINTSTLDQPRIDDAELLSLASGCAPTLAANAVEHDRTGSWVAESADCLRQAGLLAIGVPVELGGRGASIRQLAMVQRQLAQHCASTALSSSMHQHVVAFTAWRYRRGMPGAEQTLRRVADDGILLVSTGGADLTMPHGSAVVTDGGYIVNGRKRFASQAPSGTVMSTMFTLATPDGPRVINVAVPFTSPGVRIDNTWDALGMRGSGSDDVVLDDVFVPEERVMANRPFGILDGPLQVILSIAMSIVSAVYLGIAEAASVAAIGSMRSPQDPTVQRQAGVMVNRLQIASWALDGALAVVGDDPAPSMQTVAAVLAAKREVALAGIEVCDLAMEIAGGAAFRKGSPIERAYRDIRAAKFHPLSMEQTLLHAGRLALGQPCDVV